MTLPPPLLTHDAQEAALEPSLVQAADVLRRAAVAQHDLEELAERFYGHAPHAAANYGAALVHAHRFVPTS